MNPSRSVDEQESALDGSAAGDPLRSSAPPVAPLLPSILPPAPIHPSSAPPPALAAGLPPTPRATPPAGTEPRAASADDPEPRASRHDVDPRSTFEVELAREILGAEQFRATLLVAIPTITLFALVLARAASPELVVALLHGQLDLAPVGLFLMAVAAFEFVVLRSIREHRRRNERMSAARRYAQALVETSLPTAVVLYYAAVTGPVQALLMPSTFIYFVFILLSTLRLDFALCAFTGLVAAAEYAAVAILWGQGDVHVAEGSLVSLAHHLGKAFILLVSGVAAGFVAQRLRRSFTRAIESVEERQRILGVFGQHVSPAVVERLVLGRTAVKSELRHVCVMFLDIRNFTAFSESKSPEEVVDYLNTVFEPAIEAVTRHHGIVNKFLGDGFMAIFGAPILDDGESCAEAVAAALDIVARVEALVVEGRVPPTKIGIGLHAGEAVVGNIGSAERKEYTVIGDVVNVASRIEALNKELGSTILASDEVWRAARRSDVEALARDSIAIRGRTQAIRVWQLA